MICVKEFRRFQTSITWSNAFLLRVPGQSVYKLMNIVPGTCTKNQTMVQAQKQLESYESFVFHPNILNILYQKIWQFQQDSHFATTKYDKIRARWTISISLTVREYLRRHINPYKRRYYKIRIWQLLVFSWQDLKPKMTSQHCK